jgi:hypothetical protein
MKIVTNEKLIKRNARIGSIANTTGLLVLVGVMVLSFMNPNYFNLYWVGLFLGFVLSQIGIFFRNRWGRKPRLDELLDKGLKGLNDQYSIYHYTTPVDHLLIGPSGLWVLMPFYQGGKIIYDKKRYRQKGGGVVQRWLRLMGGEGIGRPELDANSEVSSIYRYLKKNLPDSNLPEPQPIMVFTNENADLDVTDAPIMTLHLKELKNNIRKVAKEKPLSPELVKEVNELFA